MMFSSSCSKSDQVDENTSDTMSFHYTNSASTSRPQFGRPPPDEPMDLADTLSYADNHPNWTQVWDPRMSTSFTTTKGLLNGPGENNCFLNSAVQVGLFGPLLWSLLVICCGLSFGPQNQWNKVTFMGNNVSTGSQNSDSTIVFYVYLSSLSKIFVIINMSSCLQNTWGRRQALCHVLKTGQLFALRP